MDYLSLNRLNTRFTVVKTDSAILYKASYTLCGDQNGPLQASYMVKMHSQFSQASYMLSGSQNGLCKPQQVFNTIYGGQNPHSEPLQVVKTHSKSIYKPNTRFVVDKTGSTCFAVFKTSLRASTGLL